MEGVQDPRSYVPNACCPLFIGESFPEIITNNFSSYNDELWRLSKYYEKLKAIWSWKKT